MDRQSIGPLPTPRRGRFWSCGSVDFLNAPCGKLFIPQGALLFRSARGARESTRSQQLNLVHHSANNPSSGCTANSEPHQPKAESKRLVGSTPCFTSVHS